jgi:hypothetical protein
MFQRRKVKQRTAIKSSEQGPQSMLIGVTKRSFGIHPKVRCTERRVEKEKALSQEEPTGSAFRKVPSA